MEGEVIYLEGGNGQIAKRPFFRWSQFALGCIFIVQGVAMLMEGKSPHVRFFFFFQIAYGCFLIIAMLFAPKFFKPKYLRFNDYGMEARLSRRETIAMRWNEIAAIDAAVFSFLVHTQDGRKIAIDLSAISYEQHKTSKARFLELAQMKGIEVRRKS